MFFAYCRLPCHKNFAVPCCDPVPTGTEVVQSHFYRSTLHGTNTKDCLILFMHKPSGQRGHPQEKGKVVELWNAGVGSILK